MRLTARGTIWPPVFKINALHMLMIGEATEYFDLWEADRDPNDTAKTLREAVEQGQGLCEET